MKNSLPIELPSELQVLCIRNDSSRIIIETASQLRIKRCPVCGQLAHRVHSHYLRTLADLTWSGREVYWQVQTRKFFCDNPQCERKIFTEGFQEEIRPYARKTARLIGLIRELGWALGGKATEHLASHLGLSVSDTTTLRFLYQRPEASVPFVQILGVDDFAFRRRQTYGTILVDLEQHRVIDLLPDRSQWIFAHWLLGHPEVQVISRDRGGDYAAGARLGAPQAQQVADRFHLLKNVGEVFERLVTRLHKWLKFAAQEAIHTPNQPRRSSPVETLRQGERRASRQERYQQVIELHQQGVPSHQIARRMGLARGTVLSYIRAETFPELAPRPRPRLIEPYLPYLQERWNQGMHNARALWREIVQQGFTGGENVVRRQLNQWRAEVSTQDPLECRKTQ